MTGTRKEQVETGFAGCVSQPLSEVIHIIAQETEKVTFACPVWW